MGTGEQVSGQDVCGVEWDDRDDPEIPTGDGYSCRLGEGHTGPHLSGITTWSK